MAKMALGSWLVVPQKKLRVVGLMTLLAISSFMTPISLDMYTPAIPQMGEYFHTTPDLVNLTLSGFFILFTIGMLVFGPISDRFGRRPSFIATYALYFAGSIACALAPNIEVLIVARLFQGIGAGGASTISIAVIKDSFVPEHRGSVLAIMQVLFTIGPIVAPLIGAAIISNFGWRMSFWVLTVVGGFTLLLSFLFEETIPDEGRIEGGVAVVSKRLVGVARNKGFMLLLLATSMLELSFMAYVAVASYIYMVQFGLSEVGYSIFFTAASVVGVFGPVIYAKVSKRTGVKLFTLGALVIACVGGALILLVGQTSFIVFWLLSMIVPIMQACMRPYITNILLDQNKHDAGNASAVISFGRGVVGSIGMLVPLIPYTNYIIELGATTVIALVIGITLWSVLMRSRIPIVGLKDAKPTKPW